MASDKDKRNIERALMRLYKYAEEESAMESVLDEAENVAESAKPRAGDAELRKKIAEVSEEVAVLEKEIEQLQAMKSKMKSDVLRDEIDAVNNVTTIRSTYGQMMNQRKKMSREQRKYLLVLEEKNRKSAEDFSAVVFVLSRLPVLLNFMTGDKDSQLDPSAVPSVPVAELVAVAESELISCKHEQKTKSK